VALHRWPASKYEKRQIVLLLIFLAGSTLSVVMTGPAHSHYLVQLTPFFAIFCSIGLTRLPARIPRIVVSLVGLVCIVISAILFVSSEYSGLTRRIKENRNFSYGPEYEIARYLRQENPAQKPVFLLSDIIVYWFIGQNPPTRLATHPSNIVRQLYVQAVEGPDATTDGELRRILSYKPAFIVKAEHVWYLEENEETTRLLGEALNKDYVLATVIDGQEIYRRK
jgi:hypothetical protein